MLRQHGPDDPELPAILTLIQTSFAYMDGVVNPPSSMHRLTVEALKATAATAEIWSFGPPLSACVVFSLKPKALYVGKLSVAEHARNKGYARMLVEHAETRARQHKRAWLELEVRIELTQNHAVFVAMGFLETSRSAHKGFAEPTSITFRRPVRQPSAATACAST